MKVKECFEQALGFLPEKPEENPGTQKFAIGWCNVLLAESFINENICRRTKNIPELINIPKVFSVEDEIPYDERIVKAAFPYGMARWIFRENEDVSGSREYYKLYVIALAEATPAIESEVKDIYC